jgi:hypothetical protein
MVAIIRGLCLCREWGRFHRYSPQGPGIRHPTLHVALNAYQPPRFVPRTAASRARDNVFVERTIG